MPTLPDRLPLEGLSRPAPPALHARVRARVGETPRPVRPLWPASVRLAVAAGAGALVAGVLLIMNWPAAGGGMALSPWVATVLTWSVGALVLTALALEEARPTAPTRTAPRLLLLAGLAALYAAAAAGHQLLAARTGEVGGPILAFMCVGMGLVTALVPAAVLLVLVLRGRPFRPVRAGAFVGAAGAFWSLAVLETCPSQLAAHKLVSHLGVAVVFAVAGAGLGFALSRFRKHP
jgi:hypothetical protein